MKRTYPHPVHVPAGFSGAMPMTAAEIPGTLDQAQRARGPAARSPGSQQHLEHFHVRRSAEHGLKGQAAHAAVRGSLRAAQGSPRKRAVTHDAYTDIDFSREQVTKVTVCSWFQGVSEADAERSVEVSHPPNWSTAIPKFYHASLPVSFSKTAGGYVPRKDTPSGGRYDLLEYVTWDWSLQGDGGIANILRIEESRPDAARVAELIEQIVQQAREESEQEAARVPRPTGSCDSPHAITYTYKLERCIQAKLASNWDSGGLDVDQGSFTVAWLPENDTLYVSGDKALRYSYEANIVPGFTSLLNMLSPAVTGVLMRQLAYDSFVTYFEKTLT
ncbi:MAG TPA: hypothetical protein VGQ57_04585 [Polyangiaceae bacterium]|jgi:hypothetical protein|nr:hypothetical protein [Polyangiaceae bacterium]